MADGVSGVSPVIDPTKSASGDEIISAKGATFASAKSTQQPVFTLALDANAQVDLAALFIANIVGRAQVAYNINIAAAQLNLIPAPNTAFATPFDNAGGIIKQTNSGIQFRGTPLGAGNTSLSVTATHTP